MDFQVEDPYRRTLSTVHLKKVIFNEVGKVDFHMKSILFKELQDLPIRIEISLSHDFIQDI